MPMPPDVESYLRSLAHRFNEPDLREAAAEVEALRAEVAQEKRWGLEAHERAGGVEERLRAEVDDWKIQDRIHRQNAFDWQLTIGELKGRIEELEGLLFQTTGRSER